MPRFSVVTPVDGTGAAALEGTLRSVGAQRMADWEHLVITAADTAPATRRGLDDAAGNDPRVRVDAVAATRTAALADAGLERARGEWVVFVAAGDELHPDALGRVASAVADDVDFVYTDEDRLDHEGWRGDPHFKPDWSPDRLRAQPYTGDLAAIRRTVATDVGGVRAELDGAHAYDLALRVTERGRRVVHVAEVLYHRRQRGAPPPGAAAAAVRAVSEHLARTRFPATAAEHPDRPGYARLEPELDDRPLVSIVIPTGAQRRLVRGEEVVLAAHCVASVAKLTTYPNYEIVCVLDDHAGDEGRAAVMNAGGDRVRIVPYPHRFDFSHKINVGALAADGDVLVLLNDDTEVITPDWIERMLMYAQDDGVGAVGARLLFEDGRLQHAGIIGTWGRAGHFFYGFPGDHAGYLDNLLVPLDLLAVTAACLMTRRAVFEEVGGLSREFPANYNDVDFCLKLHRAGYRTVCTPDASLWHYEGASRQTGGRVEGEEMQLIESRWGNVLNHDPFYGPDFLPWSGDFATPVSLTDGTLVPSRQSPGLYWLRDALGTRPNT